jgi:hypothetical protein
MTPAGQIELAPPPPDPLAGLASVEVAEARIARRRRAEVADAISRHPTCDCGGWACRVDGELVCVACSKVKR